MVQSSKMKLMPEFECWCLWYDGERAIEGNVDPSTLPLSAGLIDKLNEWSDWWDQQYDRQNPLNSGFKDQQEAVRFKECGRDLLDKLRMEMPQTEWSIRLP